MKIAVIGAKGLPPKQGGIEHYCAQVYPRMVAQGHSVDLFARSSYTDSSWGKNYEFQGVRVISLPGLNLKGLDALVSSAIGAIAASGTQYDIIHFHALGPSLFSWIPRITSCAKVVVVCHGLDWQRAKWSNFATRLIHRGEKTAVRCAHEIIVVSEFLRSYFSKTYRRETVYIPTAPATYAESDPNFSYGKLLGLTSGRYILFLGRLVPEKRPDLLLDAFCALKAEGWKLVLAGGVSDTQGFTAQILEKVADNRDVVFAGELRGARLAEIVRGAGLFVLPSDVEGLPLAMLEAMAEGVPVLGSDIPPHQQLLARDRGVLFQAGNLNSCIHSLDWALQHPSEMAAMGKKAQKYVQLNYSWERITNEVIKLSAELLTAPATFSVSQKNSKLEGV
jgi:glycosyltransferase involved in cell wall biosynthesis